MALRKIVTGNLPDPAAVEHKTLLEQIIASPLLLPFRVFWNTLNDFRADWPVLIPLLLLIGADHYRRVRKRHVRRLAARQLRADK